MTDYINGKIYIIRNNINEKVYIGSTTEDLKTRLRRHRYNAKKNKRVAMTEPINTLGEFNFNIELLEEYPCHNKIELENIENFWIGFFIGFLGKDNVYNIMIDNRNPYARGSIYERENRYIFKWLNYENNVKEEKSKSFNFKKYKGRGNALQEAINFQNKIFPLYNLL